MGLLKRGIGCVNAQLCVAGWLLVLLPLCNDMMMMHCTVVKMVHDVVNN